VAKATTELTITTTWQQIVTSGETFFLTVLNGEIFMAWSSASPAADALGHPMFDNDSYAEAATTANVWVRARKGSAKAVVSKE
jgi:hypothetical protein